MAVKLLTDGGYRIEWSKTDAPQRERNLRELVFALGTDDDVQNNFRNYKLWMEHDGAKSFLRVSKMDFLERLERFIGCCWTNEQQVTPEAAHALRGYLPDGCYYQEDGLDAWKAPKILAHLTGGVGLKSIGLNPWGNSKAALLQLVSAYSKTPLLS